MDSARQISVQKKGKGTIINLEQGKVPPQAIDLEEAVLGDPAPFFHQFGVHHGDLPGGAAKADEAEFQPVGEGLAQGRRGRRRIRGHGGVSHGISPVGN